MADEKAQPTYVDGGNGSVLLEMVALADQGRCMACGWPLAENADRGCVLGSCSFRPYEHTDAYWTWRKRTQVLELVRQGQLPQPAEPERPSNHDAVQEAVAGMDMNSEFSE